VNSASPSDIAGAETSQGRIPLLLQRLRSTSSLAARIRDYGIVVAFGLLFVGLSITSSSFLTSTNLLNILDQNAALGIIACGLTLVFIAGGFDFSVGAIFGLVGVVSAEVAIHVATFLGLLSGVLVGLTLGMVNGTLATFGRINSFIATLATSIIIGGLAVVIAQGQLITVSDPAFASLGRGSVGAVKYTTIIWFIVAVVATVMLTRSALGRYIYAVGGNAEAARLSGVRVNLIRGMTFAISGACAGVGGVLEASRVATGEADVGGVNLVLTVVAATVIGGTSILGGEGAIWRSTLGLLFLALIGNGFNLLNIDPIYQQILQGGIILLAVGIDAWARRGAP